MYLAQLIADHNYVNQSASVFGFATYYRVKLGMYHYATAELDGVLGDSGDLKKVQAYYLSEYGMDVSYSDIQQYNLVAYLGSAMTWHYWRGLAGYIFEDDVRFRIDSNVAGWRLPEGDFYLKIYLDDLFLNI